MAYDTTEAVAKFLSGFQMKITNRERDTVAPDYYVKYSLTLSKGGKDFSTTFVSDPRASGEPTVTQVFSALADKRDTTRCSPSSGRPSFLSAISTRKRFPLTAKRTIWKTVGMGLVVTPRKRMPRKRTIEMRSRL